MKVHHLNAGTLCPACAKLVNGSGGFFDRARLICHLLLIEADGGLVLVDTGLGKGDIAHPEGLGKQWLNNVRPRLEIGETAIELVKARGFSPKDVRDVLLTHLDRDHAGGINDFPWATVHVHAAEYHAAVDKTVFAREGRYIDHQWSRATRWKFYDGSGESWFGFSGVRALDPANPDVLAIPLFGHTPGHCGVAVRLGGKWLLHAGDSYYHHWQMQMPPRNAPLGLRFFQKRADTDTKLRIENQYRLRTLRSEHGAVVDIINSHDPYYYDMFARTN